MLNSGNVLVVDDEPNALKVLSMILRGAGHNVYESPDVDTALDILHRHDVDAVITDLKMPVHDGYELFEYVSGHYPEMPVMFLTAYGTVDSAVNAMSNGAFYYFIKPPDYGKLKNILSEAIGTRQARKRIETARQLSPEEEPPPSLIGTTPAMLQIAKLISATRNSESSVLIQGETGTGKEIITRVLHGTSERRSKPLIAVNCAAIPRDLIEAELFGYERGAFTGATASRAGRFEEAADGTIFLDEIGELELGLQAKLLRVLQEREIERLGSSRKIKVRSRLICSTNRDLQAEVRAGTFREDLYYRINVVPIMVPPLRERREDIPLLAQEFTRQVCVREGKTVTFGSDVIDFFMECKWPGNVRQLRNVVERTIVLTSKQKISLRDLPGDLLAAERHVPRAASITPLRQVERQAVLQALQQCNGNKSKAAQQLGISRKAFYKRLKETGVL
jgi:DNA-binding NtrC family response regulator